VDDWNKVLQEGEGPVRAHLEQSGALALGHDATCDLRYLPPAVLALCPERDLRAQYYKVRAVLGDG
jgi:hypothetical protein